MTDPQALAVGCLGERRIASPLDLSTVRGDGIGDFVPDDTRIRYCLEEPPEDESRCDWMFEKAGPREHLFFQPRTTRVAVVTCGGLCPGINNVLRSLFLELHYNYGVREVLGIPYGFRGFDSRQRDDVIRLTPESSSHIHRLGGTILGSSRGEVDPRSVAEFLAQRAIDVLICIGGDGTQRAAHAIANAIQQKGRAIGVIGIPKTIDNDVLYVDQCFGYATALEKAHEVIISAHVEARGAPSCVGLVKLMGRDAGFIAAGASVASQEVNFCLIPEVEFPLDGESGFLAQLVHRIQHRDHAVVVVAEGAGQHLIPPKEEVRDKSGNLKHQDVGTFLCQKIQEAFATANVPMNMKYFDPSYLIRSVPANSADALLCDQLGRHAAHAAMAGNTDTLIGLWHGDYIHVPIPMVAAGRRQVDIEGDLWSAVLASTGQPRWSGETILRHDAPR
jgi:6-phosphofructokinase 1